MKDIPRSKIINKTLLFNALHLYNLLDDNIKFKNPKLFQKYLNKYISNIFQVTIYCDKIPDKMP